ncbi:SMI1/KNR4 family protein [Pontibacter sp. E15-1]|uniref:SMI1/KNR4 family protein n=1 Tax=Pontibacter sp. E15-1 TaxID=2919918 RepID=UPI001F4FFE6C|nr:SMI1/KNR4 family protein [Pontibacter sp. E15-1]MCJ8166160.1 SMI1/KNR4 family protein [Pontibacter sp. E15-1]
METLERLREVSGEVPIPPKLPTRKDIENAERKLELKFPPSYVKYQLEYSDVVLGTIEPLQLFENGSYTDLVKAVREAHEAGLSEHLIPFLEDNSDFYCFDLTSSPPEYNVRFCSHNGLTDEKWENFLEWVDKCWIEESI